MRSRQIGTAIMARANKVQRLNAKIEKTRNQIIRELGNARQHQLRVAIYQEILGKLIAERTIKFGVLP
jgi:hypothetical protein